MKELPHIDVLTHVTLTGNPRPRVGDHVIIYGAFQTPKGTKYTISLGGETVETVSDEDTYIEEHHEGIVTAVEKDKVEVFSPMYTEEISTYTDQAFGWRDSTQDRMLIWILDKRDPQCRADYKC